MATMANLHQALGKLEKEGTLDRTLDKVQEAIDLLTKAKAELMSRTEAPGFAYRRQANVCQRPRTRP